jgi:hypothetical protein
MDQADQYLLGRSIPSWPSELQRYSKAVVQLAFLLTPYARALTFILVIPRWAPIIASSANKLMHYGL